MSFSFQVVQCSILFTPQTVHVTGVQPLSVVAADGNGNNKTGLIVTNYGLNSTGVLINTGNSTFITQKSYKTGGKASCAAAAETNGDNKLDILVTNCNSKSTSVILSLEETGNLS
jgi:hypothetical protein